MILTSKPILSPAFKARLLWCLAVHAEGPSRALALKAPR